MRSIRWRLGLSYTVVVLFTGVVFSFALFWAVDRYYSALERRYLSVNAQGAVDILAPMLANSSPPDKLEQQVRLLAFLSQARIRVWSSSGALLADSGPRESQSFSIAAPKDIPPTPPAYATAAPVITSTEFIVEQVVISDTDDDSSKILVAESVFGYAFEQQQGEGITRETMSTYARSDQVVRVPIQHADQVLGQIELSDGPAYSRQILNDITRVLSQVAFAAVFLGAVVGVLVGHRLSAPLLALTDVVHRMAEGNLSIRARVQGQDEITVLAKQFNTMADRIQQTLDALDADRKSLRRFTADASHEMHTPLTALASFIELLNGPRGANPATRAELLTESERQVTRLTRLTGDLLALARFDSGTAALALQPGDLRTLLEDETEMHRARAEAAGITLQVTLPDAPIIAQLDESYLRRALCNLIDNAIKFSPAGAKITLGVQTKEQMAKIWIADQGLGIAPGDLPRVFERFYRGRSAQGIAGTGLGLAIVAAIVEMHNGQVTVQSKENTGSRFEIKIPLYLKPDR